MEPLGVRFKQSRETQGLSLQDIAAKTKISVAVLEAVERNDFSRLPGGIFGRSFVRAYATEVGLDADSAVAGFVEELERSEREAAAAREAARPEITPDDQRFLERQRRALFWLRVGIAVLAVVALAGAGWALRGRFRSSSPANPSALAAPPPVMAEVPPTSATAVPPAIADPVPVSGSAVQEAAPSPAPLSIEMSLSADCWISAAIDGARPKGQLYRAGDRARFDGTREVLFDLGNAGAVTMTIGGRPAKPLGRSGARLRVRITPENAASWIVQ